VENLLRILREGNQMFATRVVETNPWYKPIIAPKGKSFCYRAFWWTTAVAAVCAVLILGFVVWTNDELKTELIDAFNLFKDG
jgi:hypothetical protein